MGSGREEYVGARCEKKQSEEQGRGKVSDFFSIFWSSRTSSTSSKKKCSIQLYLVHAPKSSRRDSSGPGTIFPGYPGIPRSLNSKNSFGYLFPGPRMSKKW